MVHGLMQQLDGAMTIRSKPGLGTNIVLWLPQTQIGLVTAVTSHEVEPSNRQGTALLVDDEELVRVSTADMLSDLGYSVIEAASGFEALRIIEAQTPLDLIITDHQMPHMTGTELARLVAGLRSDLPVLIVSGYAEIDDIASDLPRLTKPFRKDDLAAKLDEVFIKNSMILAMAKSEP